MSDGKTCSFARQAKKDKKEQEELERRQCASRGFFWPGFSTLVQPRWPPTIAQSDGFRWRLASGSW